MKLPKYSTAFCLNFESIDRFLYRFADKNNLEESITSELFERVRDCMIYFICARPKISIVPSSFQITSDEYQFDIEYRIKSGVERISLRVARAPIIECGGKITISEYPHNSIIFHNKEDKPYNTLLISNLIHLLEGVPSTVSDLEILYIGKGTSDCAIDRLKGHSTLEKILADILQKEPDNEIAFLLYNFKMKRFAFKNNSLYDKVEVKEAEAAERGQNILDYKPSNEEQTRIIEAFLIDYFKTAKYNSQYSRGINMRNKAFDSIRELDFDAIRVAVDNENIGKLKMYSNSTAPSFYHVAALDIRKKEGRISLLENFFS